MRKMLLMTLLIGSMTISGCKMAPQKPTIIAHDKENQVCFDKRDASKLGLYILSLEGGYK